MKIIKIYNQTLTLEEQVCEVLCFIKKNVKYIFKYEKQLPNHSYFLDGWAQEKDTLKTTTFYTKFLRPVL